MLIVGLLINPWGAPKGYCSFPRTAQYIVHMLKLWCHCSSLGKFYKLNVWIVPASLYLKVRVIFAMWPVYLYGEKFVFSITAWYIFYVLKLWCHYASIGT